MTGCAQISPYAGPAPLTDPERHAPTAPATVLEALQSHRGPVIIDFDETLFLLNSTEEFVNCAYPATAARIALRALDGLRPWRWTGGTTTRDNWRVGLVSTLFPWTWLVWRFRAAALAKCWTNVTLAAHLRGRENVVVASIGFSRIIVPLLKAMAITPQPRLVACRIVPMDDRRSGKQWLIQQALGETAVRQALVITDSADDADLLDACARPCRTLWPHAQWRGALEHVYLPFTYLSRVKRPGQRYLWRSVIQEDYVFWVLATVAGAAALGPHLLGLAFLLISFWAIYETGYVDNDRSGERYEADPKLSDSYAGHRVPTPSFAPWLWAAATGYAGLAVIYMSLLPPPALLLTWFAVLIATFGCFRLFNRIDKRSRIWLFGLLQFARTASIATVVTISPIGVAGLGAHLVALWVPYFFYRYAGGVDWGDLPVSCTRLLFFLLLGLLILAATGPAAMHWHIAAAFLAWNLFRARRELPRVLRQIERLDRVPQPSDGESIAHIEASERK